MAGSDDSRQMGAEENFEAMLDAYTGSMGETLKVGDRIKGTVISITADSVFVDTGTKVDGVAERSEFLDDNGELSVKEGEEVELYVMAAGAQEIRLSKALAGVGGAALLEDAYKTKLPVEGRVVATRKGGYDVDVLKRRAFCPVSQIDTRFVENAEEFVGKSFQFLIIKFEQHGRNVVVSRRALLELEQEAKRAEFMAQMQEGSVVDTKIVRLAPFGAFAEIMPGVEGLIHVSELSWSRIGAPDEAVSEGDIVRAKILSIETDKKGQLRISLSARQVTENPWARVADALTEGEIREGKVVRLTNFGAFVEVLPGIDGLVHVSEMSYTKRVHKPGDMVAVGDTVTVKVKGIDLAQQRVSLSMKEAEGDPWSGVVEQFSVGATLEGKVESRTEFGLFIALAPGVTGLMPKSNMAKAPKAANLDNAKPGDTLQVTVAQIRAQERKITLAPVGVETAEDTSWKEYRKPRAEKGPVAGSDAPAFENTLGAALKNALKNK
ncbi:30S ribosomal protein S1 [Desulfovibrio psychrotolerans]|uniref:30S ribosomal protein S1 n=1 Tax=Desulfovibrio psychrotolerans TaxID=415242 RepID=A0A7J0BQS4_9BACT|nr:30S ribosomal protein S1 [Desulfovibrio psychrotolerans]GFM35541.1 30S ribosomal protein S1 [Desulfovibrio psychrotolerans]